MIKQIKLKSKAPNYFSDNSDDQCNRQKTLQDFQQFSNKWIGFLSIQFPLTTKIKEKLLHKTQLF
jgi:hypothetical protein